MMTTTRDTSFFDRLDDRLRTALAEAGTYRVVADGESIAWMGMCWQDTPITIIKHGAVKITSIGSDGQQALVEVRGPGDIVGASEALDGGRRETNAVMCAAGYVLVISASCFRRLLGEQPGLLAEVSHVLAGRLRRWHRQQAQAMRPASQRLAALLLSLATDHGIHSSAGIRIAVDLSQAELSSAIGVSRETVERTLRMWRSKGLVSTGYRMLIIPDLDALRELAE
jgi:CRP/FNR family cyclic AMP-dependent transcriptional regulator